MRNWTLDALGFGGGYSQEVSWSSGGGPAVSCPKGLTDLFSFCSTNSTGGWALIPDGLRTELALTASASGNRALDVRPGVRSLAYDGTVAAIGIALETLSPGPIGSNAAQVASLAIQLLPEAAGFEAAMERKDYTAAGFELLSLSKRAMTIIADHVTAWAIGAIVDLIPGLLEVKLGIAVSKAIVVLANLDAHLLAGNSVTSVTVGYGGGGGASGKSGSPQPSSSVTAVLRSGTFSPTGSMATAREGHTAALLTDGRVLVAGGGNGSSGIAVASAELYDPKTGTFTATGSMLTARTSHTATLLADGRVLVAGGGSGFGDFDSAEIYDPRTGTFNATGSMATGRYYHTATLLTDGRVLVAGGGNGRSAFDSAEIYDPRTGTFNATGSMATGRWGHTATLLTDGRVLVAGGGNGFGDFDSAEIYEPRSGTFSATGSMATARYFLTATLLADGRVLVAGGGNGPSGFASAEIYDPRTGSFNATGSMATARYYHTATLLADGRVLIAGGRTDMRGPNLSAERYRPGGESGGTTPTPTPTPTPAPVVTPIPAPVVTHSPAIISVSGVAPTATQTIRIDGSGFGQHAPYTGSTSFIELSDLTGGWNAGWHEPGSPYSDTITLRIASWTDSEIVVGAWPEIMEQSSTPADTTTTSISSLVIRSA